MVKAQSKVQCATLEVVGQQLQKQEEKMEKKMRNKLRKERTRHENDDDGMVLDYHFARENKKGGRMYFKC